MFHETIGAVLHALSFAFAMGWQILGAFSLGLTLPNVVRAAVSKGEMSRLLLDDSPRIRH
jgi:hypothetical protein